MYSIKSADFYDQFLHSEIGDDVSEDYSYKYVKFFL